MAFPLNGSPFPRSFFQKVATKKARYNAILGVVATFYLNMAPRMTIW